MKSTSNLKVWVSRKLAVTLATLAFLPLLLLQPADGQTTDAQATTQPTMYTVTDLGTLGGSLSLGTGINNKGWVNGLSTLPGDTAIHAFLWRNGVMTDLGTPGGPNSGAGFPLNERGQVPGAGETSTPDRLGEDFCGFSAFSVSGTHICLPFVWQNGVMTRLPTLGGNNGEGKEINNRGQMVGTVESSSPDPTCVPPQVLQAKPVLWENGRIQEFPTFPGDLDGEARAINDQGLAVGDSGDCNAGFHALLWQNGMVTDLGNLGGTTNNIPQDINNEGQVVGQSNLPGDAIFHAFLWQEGVMRDLGTLSGDVSSEADGINSKGQVVGASIDANGNPRAFLWQNGRMTDLNTLTPPDSALFLLWASGYINSRGQIAGFGLEISTGEIHAFLATPSNDETASQNGTPLGARRQSPEVALPKNLRNLLRQRLGHR